MSPFFSPFFAEYGLHFQFQNLFLGVLHIGGKQMKIKIALGSIMLLSACMSTLEVPQTRKAYKAHVATKPDGKTESFSAKSSYGNVVALLERQSGKCFNKTITISSNGMRRDAGGAVIWRSSMRKPSAKSAELSVQIEFRPSGGVKTPPGGYYVLAVDISESASGNAHVAMYGPIEDPYAAAYRAVKAWIEGRDMSCPKLLGE